MPVPVPSTVKVNLSGRSISVEGPKGKLQLDLPERTEAKLEDDQIIVTRENDEKRSKAMHGLARSLINNMVVGVDKGFVKKLKNVLMSHVFSTTSSHNYDVTYW